jgi:hypothetical protein
LKIKFLLVVSLVLVIMVAGVFAGCSPKPDGSMPHFTIGDKWVSRWDTAGQVYTVTMEIISETTVNGESCWVFQTSFDPAYQNVVSITNKYKKTNLDIVVSDYKTDKPDGSFTSINFQVVSSKPFYPLEVNKVVTETDYEEITYGNKSLATTENTTEITATLVEKIETVKVPAGNFDCFKVLKYNASGNVTQISWRSDKVKLFQVKMIDSDEPDARYELISFYTPDSISK